MAELLLCLALQLLLYGLLGEMVVRWFGKWSPWKTRIPEAAFLAGLPAYALAGYLALWFSRSVSAIPIAGLLLTACLWLAIGQQPLIGQIPGLFAGYRTWRKSQWFRLSLGMAMLLVLLVGAVRIPWLLQIRTAEGVVAGTAIWDDLRTLGGPIVLAAQGLPLRSPIALEMQWPYPAASFIAAAGAIAWSPAHALPILVADTMIQALFYALAIVVMAPLVAGAGPGSALFCGTALISAAFNLWHLPLKPEWDWVEYFFGYHRTGGLFTTIGWTPYAGLVWISNHSIGLAAILLACRWPALCSLFALFAAGSSMDMSAMAGVVLGCVLIWRGTLRLWQKQPLPWWFWRAAVTGLLALVLIVILNYPTLSGKVDSPMGDLFPRNRNLRFSLGMLACGIGPYLLVSGAAVLLARGRTCLAGAGTWLVAIGVGMAFSLVFEFNSIWFWRFSFAAHVLFGMVCAVCYRNLQDRPQVKILATLWLLCLIPGTVELGIDAVQAWKAEPRHSADYADALTWIRTHTPLQARVAEALDAKGVIAPSVDFLRTGNRGGINVYDRSHALVGFEDYRRRFSDIVAAIAGNDYLLVRSTSAYVRVMQVCGASRVFHNVDAAVYEINAACRASLPLPEIRSLILDTFKPLWNPNADVSQQPTEVVLFAVQENPERIAVLRKRIETLWSRAEWERAEYLGRKMLELRPDLAEAHYSYAFTLQVWGKSLETAVHHYDEALRLGYAEFWVRYNRGTAYLGLKQYQRAFEDLSVAQKLDPKHEGVKPLLQQAAQALQTAPATPAR